MEANEVHYRQDGNPPDDLETSSLSPLLATSVAPQNRHEAIIKQIEGGLQHVNRLIRAPVLLKYGLNFALQSSAAVLNTSTSIKSTDNPAAASRASAEATRHLALILSDAPLDKKNDFGWGPYRLKLEQVQRQIQASIQWPSERYRSAPTWHLIRTAARLSKEAYDKHPTSEGIIFEAREDINATIMSAQKVNNHQLLVVAIKGSESRDDWLLNFNGKPTVSSYSKKLLDGEVKWHKGFLHVASIMEAEIVKAIQSIKDEQPGIRSVLFTGHSAGGAIAQILFAASNSPATDCYKVVAGWEISCITFGCPPVASTRIPPEGSNKFVAVINEDDPVPLAQEAYIKTLIDVYGLDRQGLEKKYKVSSTKIVPTPVLRVSGTCVVMKEVDADAVDGIGFEAFEVPPENVEDSLFGNPLAHLMDEYIERVDYIASQNGVIAE